MNKKIWTAALLIAALSVTSTNFVNAGNTINATKINNNAVKAINLDDIDNFQNWENIEEYKPTLKEIKEYLPKELESYKKAAKTDSVKKKIDELLSKLKKVSKLEDAEKLEKEFSKLFEDENNFDYDKLPNMQLGNTFQENIEDVKKYFTEELNTYKKIAKNSTVTKKIEEIASKLAKTTKIEEAYKLQDDFYKLFEGENNFDYDKLETIQTEEEFTNLEKELENYKKSDKADLQKKLAKLKTQSKEIAEMQKKINAYYEDLYSIQEKIYPEMKEINFEDCEKDWECDFGDTTAMTNLENTAFQITDNKKAIELAKTLKEDNVKSTLDNYFSKNSIKDETQKIKFVEEVMSYYAVMSNWEAHKIYLVLEEYRNSLEK